MPEDLGDKTEPATERRRRETRLEGSVPKSTDLGGALAMGGAMVVIFIFAPSILRDWTYLIRQMLTGNQTQDPLSIDTLLHDFGLSGWMAIKIGAPLLSLMFIISFLSMFWQVGFLATLRPLQPKGEKISPLSGIKKLFGLRTLVKAGTNAAKISLVLLVAIVFITSRFHDILALPKLEFAEAVVRAGQMLMQMAMWLLLVLIFLGVVDYIYQKWQWERDNRMTKQEVKEEQKAVIGDPKVKAQQRKFAQKIMSQRLGAAVPTADVVVTNPEHLAIALQWDSESMFAPRVVAKGADYMALRIRQIATLHGVPIVERKPLARAMYSLVEVGDEIPPQFYAAVAEILAYVYRLEGRKAG